MCLAWNYDIKYALATLTTGGDMDTNIGFVNFFEGNTPVLLEMPHSGFKGIETTHSVPGVIKSRIRFHSDEVRRTIGFGCDAAVPEMSGFFELTAKLNLSGIYNDLARVYCDTNRGRSEVSGLAVEGYDTDKYHSGVIWGRTIPSEVDLTLSPEQLEEVVKRQCEKTLNTPLTGSEFEILLRKVYDPYHEAVTKLHRMAIERHGYCVHLALHSLPPVAVTSVNGGYVCGKKAKRGAFEQAENTLPDVILIHNNFKAADIFFIERIRHVFQSAGLIVDDGEGPFAGNNGVTKLYGNPEKRVNVIGIEHVTHDIEPKRHLGNPEVNFKKARMLRTVYEQAVRSIL